MPALKGIHYALESGRLAAEAAFRALQPGESLATGGALASYDDAVRESFIYKELNEVRNMRQVFGKGLFVGGALASAMTVTKGKLPPKDRPTHPNADARLIRTGRAARYPVPDGTLTFDKLSSVYLSNTNHEEDQPSHLVLRDPTIPIRINLPEYAEPATRYCPAAVYEVLYDEAGANPRFQINAQNCVHCKTCDIKDPSQNINWVTPEGGGGPNYANL